MSMIFVANVLDLKTLGTVASYTSKHGQFIVVVDAFTSINRYQSEVIDDSDGTYGRSISTVTKLFEENGWNFRSNMRVTKKLCKDCPKVGKCIYCASNPGEPYHAVSALLFESQSAPTQKDTSLIKKLYVNQEDVQSIPHELRKNHYWVVKEHHFKQTEVAVTSEDLQENEEKLNSQDAHELY